MAEFPKISETFILHQIVHLEKLGHKLSLFALGNPRQRKLHEVAENILPRVIYLKSSLNPKIWLLNFKYLLKNPFKYLYFLFLALFKGIGFKKFIQSWYFVDLLESSKLDLIHAHFGFAGKVGVILKKYFKVPLITYFYGIDASPLKYSKRDYKALFKNTDIVLALSEYMVPDLIELGCPKKKIRIMHVGIDMEKFKEIRLDNKRFGSKLVLAVGRLEEKKGFDDLIYAFKDVKDASLIIIGPGEKEKELKKQAKALGLGKRVRFLGALEYIKVLDYLSKANLLVAPSKTSPSGDKEGTPVILMDAGALGVPVVSTKHSGIPEVVLDGKSGILVKERDIKGLVQAITKILKDPALARKYGVEGKKHIEKEFNAEIQAKRISEIYSKLK